jgi:hypothetical protein
MSNGEHKVAAVVISMQHMIPRDILMSFIHTEMSFCVCVKSTSRAGNHTLGSCVCSQLT